MQIDLTKVSFQFENELLLSDLDLNIESGSCVVISGESGCGKSLLFSILCGLIQPTSGDVVIDGKNLNNLNQKENLNFRKYLGAVFQRPALISNLSLYENLMLPLNRHFSRMVNKKKGFSSRDTRPGV